jgi:hypothetical protein
MVTVLYSSTVPSALRHISNCNICFQGFPCFPGFLDLRTREFGTNNRVYCISSGGKISFSILWTTNLEISTTHCIPVKNFPNSLPIQGLGYIVISYLNSPNPYVAHSDHVLIPKTTMENILTLLPK